jgi:drug/metabolite transporter (DMT)-like permease
MTPIAIALVTVSAFTHAAWNLLGKRQNPSSAFFLIASAAASVALAPVVVSYRRALPMLPGSLWLLIAVTGVFQTLYYIGLAAAYRHGDLSVAYPLVRALPSVLIAAITLMLGMGKPLSLAGGLGILAVALGCLILPLPALRFQLEDYLNLCCLMAVAAAIGTSGYTLVDNQALAQLRQLPGLGLSHLAITLVYLECSTVSTTLMLAAYTLLDAPERARLREVWARGKVIAALAGVIILGTYGLVLVAMAYATNVSYVAAFRQLSIPLGAFLGLTIQREPRHTPKLVGIGFVLIGLILIALA